MIQPEASANEHYQQRQNLAADVSDRQEKNKRWVPGCYNANCRDGGAIDEMKITKQELETTQQLRALP